MFLSTPTHVFYNIVQKSLSPHLAHVLKAVRFLWPLRSCLSGFGIPLSVLFLIDPQP